MLYRGIWYWTREALPPCPVMAGEAKRYWILDARYLIRKKTEILELLIFVFMNHLEGLRSRGSWRKNATEGRKTKRAAQPNNEIRLKEDHRLFKFPNF
jgi:hypothetical protein